MFNLEIIENAEYLYVQGDNAFGLKITQGDDEVTYRKVILDWEIFVEILVNSVPRGHHAVTGVVRSFWEAAVKKGREFEEKESMSDGGVEAAEKRLKGGGE